MEKQNLFVDYTTNSADKISLSIVDVIHYIDLITEIEGRMAQDLTGPFRNKHQDPRLNVLMANGINRNSAIPHTAALEVSKNFSKVAEILANESYIYYKNMMKIHIVGLANDTNLMLLSLMTNSVTIANAIISIASNVITGSELDKVSQAVDEMKLDIQTYSKALSDFMEDHNGLYIKLRRTDDKEELFSDLITGENVAAIADAYDEIRHLYLTSNNAIFLADYEKENSIVKKIVEEVIEPGFEMVNRLAAVIGN